MSEKVELSENEIDLLAWNVANEVLNGFAITDFAIAVGASPEAFKQLVLRLRSVRSEYAP